MSTGADINDLYNRCFPTYQVEAEDFYDAVKPEEGHIIYAYEGSKTVGFAHRKGEDCEPGKVVGFAIIHSNAIVLLCVDAAFRGRGHGSSLLEQAEVYITKSGADKIILGRGEHYLLQGVPMNNNDAAVTFFQKRGYTATWESCNMRLDLTGFDKSKLTIPPKPDSVAFRFADYANETEKTALLTAVMITDPSWEGFYSENDDPVMLAVEGGMGGNIVGMQILSPDGALFLPNKGGFETRPYDVPCAPPSSSGQNAGCKGGFETRPYGVHCASPPSLRENVGCRGGFQTRPHHPDAMNGCIACVGTVPAARRRGIALQMVAEGAAWLKEQGCESVELLYVGLEDWYGRVGFVSTGKQWMGEKLL
ncbi:MAG: GNAT family N-acetyltransferase [Lachnospiraceae bacterium]|jgi:ribosomal protein S18 acetylase RimI-like enzyme|nr:GNAT family N-acetyltransferase [Lachnospiraceae bacterium]